MSEDLAPKPKIVASESEEWEELAAGEGEHAETAKAAIALDKDAIARMRMLHKWELEAHY